ncbi:MAG: SMP-30/gluconolactonase/LRE family protein [Planctomycetales bacterium]|nr:SMP-30/gluconolactonase/LRE family protein [Planctomycetales bacterium]
MPEGPTALGEGKFSWVAIQHGPESKIGSLNIFDVATGQNTTYPLPGRPGFAKPTSNPNKFIVGCERQLGIFDIRDSSWTTLADGIDEDVENTIINDGTLYANNIVFGTKDLEFKTPKAGLYLYRGSDQKLIRLRNDQICSNGKDVVDLGDGGLSLLDIDSPTKKVVRYRIDIESGELTDCKTLIDLGDLPAVPDGMICTPDEQSIIISFYNPNPAEFGETRQYSLLTGDLERVWLTPDSPQATCPLLLEVAPGEIKLIITTAVEYMSIEQQKSAVSAGGIFVADSGFPTAPSSPAYPLKVLA